MKCIPAIILLAVLALPVYADPGTYSITRMILFDSASPTGTRDSADPFQAKATGIQTFNGAGQNEITGSFCIVESELCLPFHLRYLVEAKDSANKYWTGMDLETGLPLSGSNLSWNPTTQRFEILYTVDAISFFDPVPPGVIPDGIVLFILEMQWASPLPLAQEAEPREPMQILSFDLAPSVDWRDVDLWDIIEPRAGRQISGLIF